MRNQGKSIRLFLVDGSPGGLLAGEIINWTGHVVAAPRSDLKELLDRGEVAKTGIYILIGDDPSGLSNTRAYVGEADVVANRLKAHARAATDNGKDFWSRAIVITSKDSNLTKSHARFLEARLLELAVLAKRATLDNTQLPIPPSLPESDRSDMEQFIDQVQVILPVLGVNLFRTTSKVARASSDEPASKNELHAGDLTSPIFTLHVPLHGLIASAREIDGEFTVLQGSTAQVGWPTAASEVGYRGLKEKLEGDGTLVLNDATGLNVFTHDQVFASPSAAGAVIVGHAVNGRKKWKDTESGLTFGEWQTAGIDLSAE
jgi:hypothetical protein